MPKTVNHWILRIGLMGIGDVSKSGHHFRKKSNLKNDIIKICQYQRMCSLIDFLRQKEKDWEKRITFVKKSTKENTINK